MNQYYTNKLTYLFCGFFVFIIYLFETWYKPVPPQRPHSLRPQWLFLPQFAISPEHCSVSMSRAIFKEFSVRAVCQLDDQCRGSSVKEKDHLAGKLTNLYCAIGPIFSVYGQGRLEDICSAGSLPHCHTHLYSHASS